MIFSVESRERFLLQKADLDFVLIYDKKRTSWIWKQGGKKFQRNSKMVSF